MIALISVFCLMIGTIGASLASRYPAKRLMLERLSGVMIVAGLVLIGIALPLFR